MTYQFTEPVYLFEKPVPAGTLIADTDLMLEFEEGHTITTTEVPGIYVCDATGAEYSIFESTIEEWLEKGYIKEIE